MNRKRVFDECNLWRYFVCVRQVWLLKVLRTVKNCFHLFQSCSWMAITGTWLCNTSCLEWLFWNNLLITLCLLGMTINRSSLFLSANSVIPFSISEPSIKRYLGLRSPIISCNHNASSSVSSLNASPITGLTCKTYSSAADAFKRFLHSWKNGKIGQRKI